MAGRYTDNGRFQRMFQEVSAAVRASGREPAIAQAFAGLSSNVDRISFLLGCAVIRPALRIPAPAQTAAAARAAIGDARTLREEGNDKFKKRLFTGALNAYNRSILCCRRDAADSESRECLAVCYANRSAAWYRLGELDCCLSDIAAALAYGYPKRLAHKLYERKARCLLGLSAAGGGAASLTAAAEAASDALAALAFAQLCPADEDCFRRGLIELTQACSRSAGGETQQQQQQNAQPQEAVASRTTSTVNEQASQALRDLHHLAPLLTGGPNPAYPALSSLVDVGNSDQHGRHVVARSRVDVGDVILVEEPFSAVLSPDCMATHCFSCLWRFKAFYPCRCCQVALYCSLRCEAASWTAYHRFECDNVEALVGCGIAMGHLALRAALVGGLAHYCLNGGCRSSSNGGCASATPGACPGSALPVDGVTLCRYAGVFRLESHEADRSPVDLFWRSLAALYLALCAGPSAEQLLPPGWRRSPVAETHGSSSSTQGDCDGGAGGSDLLIALATVVLHHLQVFPCNAHEISELRGVAGEMQNSELAEIGAGIYASLSLFNHSCDPSMTRTFVGRAAVVRCLRPLLAGEQAYDNYGVVYATHSLAERLAKLSKQYYFECACTACTNDWPLYQALLGSESQLTALPCLHKPAASPSSSSGAPRCPSCMDQACAVDTELHECLAAVCSGSDTACSSDMALRLASCLQRLYGLVAKPCKAFNDCEESLKHCFNRAGNCHVLLRPPTPGTSSAGV